MSTEPARLGVLSIHLDGAPCAVRCEFCYLGARVFEGSGELDPQLLTDALAQLAYAEVAVALSDGAPRTLALLATIAGAAMARGRPVTVTTTAAVARALGRLPEAVTRVSVSVDPHKGPVDPERLGALAARLRSRPLEVVLIVSLTSEAFAEQLAGGLLERLVDLEAVDAVALSALKPPPAWCDRAFWLRLLARLEPLLARALERRLFLDCYVAARLLALGGCPARPDLSPAGGGLAFRACVYQAAADFTVVDAAVLTARLRGFTAPATCPFPIR